MASSQQNSSPFWGSFIFALLGALYCAALASPIQEALPCPSSGCRLFRDVSVAGVSLWWFGTAAFVFLAFVCVSRLRSFALICAGFFLLLDCALLLAMFFTAPCLTCLGAAFFFALVYVGLRRPASPRLQASQGARCSLLLVLWGILFTANLGNAVSELMGDWAIHGPDNADIRVYYSPSCPACRDAVIALDGRAAFYPVAERDEDYPAIAAMRDALDSGKSMTEALGAAFTDQPALSSFDLLLLRLRLLRNKGRVMGMGFTKLPLLMINGMPEDFSALAGPGASSAVPGNARDAVQNGAGAPYGHDLPPELNGINLGQCGDDIAPCDTTPPAP